MPLVILFPLALSDHQRRTMSVPERSLQIGGGEPNMVNIERMRNHSELFRAECLRLMSDACKQCKHMQNEGQHLGNPDSKRLDFVIAEGNAAKPVQENWDLFPQISGSKTSISWRRSWDWSCSWSQRRRRNSPPCKVESWKPWRPTRSRWGLPFSVWKRGQAGEDARKGSAHLI